MVQLHQLKEAISESNTRVIAISVDGPTNANFMIEKTGVDIDILCDENLEAIGLYGLEDDQLMPWDIIDGKSSKDNGDRRISLCANVLINQEGFITSQWQGHYNFRQDHHETIKILNSI